MKPVRQSSRIVNATVKSPKKSTVSTTSSQNPTSVSNLAEEDLLGDNWISATSTYNYMMKDPLLDWLKHHHGSLVHKNRKYRKVVDQGIDSSKSGYNFASYIMEQGISFEKKIMKLITKKFDSDRIAEIHGEKDPRNPKKAQETLDAMRRGIPIIHSGVLHDPEHETFGIPDLLVRSDWIKYLVREPPHLFQEVETLPAPKLERPWHYVVIDIKFTGLLLRADAAHLLNAASFPAYKSQLLVYNWGLGYMQGYVPHQVYILGRRWKYTSKGETHTNNTCFDKLGIIDYVKLDQKYVEQTENALAWIREVRSEEAADWNITNYPLHRWELYPNMCNSHDHPWHAVKQQIATQNKELTELWMVGPKNRTLALNAGIYQWTDKKCTPETLGVTGKKTSRILREILYINRHKTLKISPDIIKNNVNDWKELPAIEFYVDFETSNGAVSGIKKLPEARMENIIFMIGVGFIDPLTLEWTTKDFVVNRLSLYEEEKICRAFSTFIREKAAEHGVKNPRCIHWSSAEDNMWNGAVERHDPISDQWKSYEWSWCDLLEVFKKEPIVINGCMGFGLKEVAAAMKKHGFIECEWDKNSECVDGQGAMVAARKAHNLARKAESSMKKVPIMKQVLKYNRIDVRVLYEILTYIRTNHTGNELCHIEKSRSIQSNKRKRDESDELSDNPPNNPFTKRRRIVITSDASSTEIPQPEKRGKKRARDDDEESRPTKKIHIDKQPNESLLDAMNQEDHIIDPVVDHVSSNNPPHRSNLRVKLRPRY